jgi:hypothetical protein
MPLGKDVGDNIKELRAANANKPKGKKRGKKQILAIALDGARQAGNKSVKSKKK